jgi:hypothetical protein
LGYSVERSSKIIPLIESIIAGIDQVGFLLPPLLLDTHCLGKYMARLEIF